MGARVAQGGNQPVRPLGQQAQQGIQPAQSARPGSGAGTPVQQTGPGLNSGPPNPPIQTQTGLSRPAGQPAQQTRPVNFNPASTGQTSGPGSQPKPVPPAQPVQSAPGGSSPAFNPLIKTQPGVQPARPSGPVNFNPPSTGQTSGPGHPPGPARPAGRSTGNVDWNAIMGRTRPPVDLSPPPSGMTSGLIGQQRPAQPAGQTVTSQSAGSPVNPVLQRRQQRMEQVERLNPLAAEFIGDRGRLSEVTPRRPVLPGRQTGLPPDIVSRIIGSGRTPPGQPTQPTQSALPVQQAQPTQPVQQAQATQPAQPVQPAQPLSVYAPATAYAAPTMWYGVGGQSSGYLGPNQQVLFQPSSVTYGQMVTQGTRQLPLAANILSPYLMQMMS